MATRLLMKGERCAWLCGAALRVRRSAHGFTLIELMVTLAVGAILLTIAVPSFIGITRDARMREMVRTFYLDATYARSESIKRVADVVVCRRQLGSDACQTADPATPYASNDWPYGWIIYWDRDGAAGLSGSATYYEAGSGADDVILRVRTNPRGSGTTHSVFGRGISPFINFITFTSDGASNAAGRFDFVDERGSAIQARLCVATTGRIRELFREPDKTDAPACS